MCGTSIKYAPSTVDKPMQERTVIRNCVIMTANPKTFQSHGGENRPAGCYYLAVGHVGLACRMVLDRKNSCKVCLAVSTMTNSVQLLGRAQRKAIEAEISRTTALVPELSSSSCYLIDIFSRSCSRHRWLGFAGVWSCCIGEHPLPAGQLSSSKLERGQQC